MTTRTCANCAAFYPDPDIENAAPECWNMTSFTGNPRTAQALRRAPGPTDCCGHHQTHQEDAAQSRYIDANRDAIMAGIRQHAAEQVRQDAERDQLRAAEAGAERILQQVMVKMRKGSAS